MASHLNGRVTAGRAKLAALTMLVITTAYRFDDKPYPEDIPELSLLMT
jgi:hypothetical protein